VVGGTPPLLELLLKENEFFCRRVAPHNKNLGAQKNGNGTRFFPKTHFVLPPQLIYAVSDQFFHCRWVVMKNFEGKIILLYTKNLTKNGERIKRNL